jgi:hypothetical protein
MTSTGEEYDTVKYLTGVTCFMQALDRERPPADSFFEYVVPANSSIFSCEPREEDAAFFVAEGEAVFTSGETCFLATPGTFLFLPQLVSLGCTVSPSGPVRLFSWATPLGLAARATRLGAPGEALVLSPPPTFASEKRQQLAMLLRAYLEKGIGGPESGRR